MKIAIKKIPETSSNPAPIAQAHNREYLEKRITYTPQRREQTLKPRLDTQVALGIPPSNPSGHPRI